MTVEELAERMSHHEFLCWAAWYSHDGSDGEMDESQIEQQINLMRAKFHGSDG